MSEHLGKKAHREEEEEGRTPVLSLTTARRMLPLIRQIIDDLLASRRGLAQLQPEEDRLQRARRTLTCSITNPSWSNGTTNPVPTSF